VVSESPRLGVCRRRMRGEVVAIAAELYRTGLLQPGATPEPEADQSGRADRRSAAAPTS
jgi:hypothetical protein